MKLVVDASAILYAHEGGPMGEAARAFRAAAVPHDLFAPAIVLWEVGNRYVRNLEGRGLSGPGEAATAVLGLLEEISFDTVQRETVAATIALAVRLNLTFYDASYLELAQRIPEAVLVTEDGPLKDAAREVLGDERAVNLAKAVDLLGGPPPI